MFRSPVSKLLFREDTRSSLKTPPQRFPSHSRGVSQSSAFEDNINRQVEALRQRLRDEIAAHQRACPLTSLMESQTVQRLDQLSGNDNFTSSTRRGLCTESTQFLSPTIQVHTHGDELLQENDL